MTRITLRYADDTGLLTVRTAQFATVHTSPTRAATHLRALGVPDPTEAMVTAAIDAPDTEILVRDGDPVAITAAQDRRLRDLLSFDCLETCPGDDVLAARGFAILARGWTMPARDLAARFFRPDAVKHPRAASERDDNFFVIVETESFGK